MPDKSTAKRSLFSGDKTEVVLSLGVRILGVIAGFAVTFLISRKFGAAATGQFAIVSQTAMFLAVVALLGLNVSVVRHFSKAVAQKKALGLQSVARVVGAWLGLISIVVAVLWLGAEFFWSALFGDVVPLAMLVALCVLLFVRSGVQLLGGILRSQQSFVSGQVIAVLTIPAFTTFALLLGFVGDVHEALWASAIGGIASVVVGFILVARHVGRGPESVNIPMRTLAASSLPLWGVGIAHNIGDWYSLVIAAQMLSAADAGYFRVCVQITVALQVIANSVFSVYSAKISAAFHDEDREKTAKLARTAMLYSACLAVPVALVLLLFGAFILEQFGPEFVAALPVFMCLVVGQLIFTLTGPAGLVLAMSGNERVNLMITIAGMAAVLVLTPIGALYGGLLGIAIAVTTALVVRNLTAYMFVRQRVGIDIVSGRILSGFEENRKS